MTKTIGISDMKYSNQSDDVLITYSLGSCVGLSLYDPTTRVGLLLHCLLPLSSIDTKRAQDNPFMFTDTGVSAALQTMFQQGSRRGNIIAKVAGCGSPLAATPAFNIGERNWTVTRKVLWKNDVLIAAQDIGGSSARTMILRLDSGKTFIKSGGSEVEL